MRRLLLVAAWLLAGHVALAGVYWGLLNVPESSPLMLAVSVVLAGVLVTGASGLYAGALLASDPLRPAGRMLAAGFRRFYWIAPAALIFGGMWWITAWLSGWHASARGAIDATLMLHFGWADPRVLHAAITSALIALLWVVGLALALGALSAGLAEGAAGLRTWRWLTSSLHPRILLVIAVLELVLVILPWHYVYWRPHGLPVRAEPLFVAVKLGLLACLTALAAAALARTIVRARTPPPV